MDASQGAVREAPQTAEGKLVFLSDRVGTTDVWAMNADGTGVHNLTNIHVGGPFSDVEDPLASPDGTKVAFTASSKDADRENVYVMNADGGEVRALATGWHPTWSPDGNLVAFLTDSFDEVDVVRADGSDRRKVAGDVRSSSFAWSPDGTQIGYGTDDAVVLARIDGAAPKVLAAPAGSHPWRLSWSPDGSRIAFLDDGRLYVVRTDGGGVAMLATAVERSTPAWSPDGSRIAFGRPDGSTQAEQVFVINADGTGLRGLTASEAGERSLLPAWTPDGGTIVYTRDRFNGWDGADLWSMRADGSEKRALTNAFEQDGSSSYAASAAVGSEPAGGWQPPKLRLVAPGGKTRGHAGRVTGLAADTGRVAFSAAFGSAATNCGPVSIWTPATNRVAAFENVCGGAQDLYSVGVGGRRVAWAQYESGSGRTAETLFSGSLGNPTPRKVDVVDVREGYELGAIMGDGSLLVYNTWHWSDSGKAENGRLWRISAGGKQLLKSGPDALEASAVDGGRILVWRLDGALAVLSSRGKVVRRLPFARDTVRGAKLSGSHVAVLTATHVDLYDIRNGKRVRHWPVAAGSSGRVRLQDLDARYAVYVAGLAIHALRLSDGHDVTLRLADEGPPARAALTPSGLFYSYNQTWTKDSGRLGLVPLKRLARMAAAAGRGNPEPYAAARSRAGADRLTTHSS